MGLTPKGRYDFQLIRNDGGRRRIDCGFLAVRDAAKGVMPRSFIMNDTPENIRKDMVELFKGLDQSERFYVSFGMLSEKQVQASNQLDPYTPKIEADVIHAIMNKTMPWEFIVFYMQKRYPNQVNLMVWNHIDALHFKCASETTLDRGLPILHIAHWGKKEHYEAIIPMQDACLELDLKGF